MRILSLVLIFLVALFIIFSILDRINKRKPRTLWHLPGIIITILLMFFDVFYQRKNDALISDLRAHFNRGGELSCKNHSSEIKVSNKTFNLINGTLSLNGKKGSENEGLFLDLKDCKITNVLDEKK